MRIELPAPVLPESAREAAAQRLGLTVEQVEQVAYGHAALRDGKVFTEGTFFEAFPDDDFDDHCGTRVLPEDLLLRSLDVPRDPAQFMGLPITEADRAAADVAMVAASLRRLEELNAPSILLRNAHFHLQLACESISTNTDPWQPLSELMTGQPASAGAAGSPSPMFAVPFGSESDETTPGDAAFVDGGFFVAWQYASIVFDLDGTIRDVFPSCGLRVVGSDSKHLALVCGGGGVADSGYFGAEVFIRDTRAHQWLPRGAEVPSSLPRFVAGTIGDVKWAVVVDVTKGVGYRTSPRAMGDQCGETFNSACGRYAWDRERFVLDAATGAAVLDAQRLEGSLVGFAKTATAWRFLMLEELEPEQPDDRDELSEEEDLGPRLHMLLKDETNAVVRSFGAVAGRHAFALSADGMQVLAATQAQLSVTEAHTGAVTATLDLSTLASALRLPADEELWQRLAAAYGVPHELATRTLAQAREAIADTFGEEPSDAELERAIEAAAARPPLPKRVERT